MSATLWTIGHSNRSLEAFLELLRENQIECLADVRRFPGSRKHPQFGKEELPRSLAAAGIEYRHFEALGGRRRERLPNSPNTAWRVEQFAAYADYTLSAEFEAALAELMDLARSKRTAIMCAEADWHSCHRRLIADVLVARGWQVLDIVRKNRTEPHALPDFARIENDRVIYPGATLF
jgi:uncharacterized protein (DUF488 family)